MLHMLRPPPSAQRAPSHPAFSPRPLTPPSHPSCSRTFVEASSTILYSAFARIEADALPAGSSVVASTAPGVSSILSSSLPAWALFSGLNVFVLSGTTAAGTAFTRLRSNAIRFVYALLSLQPRAPLCVTVLIRLDIDFASTSGVPGFSGSRRLLQANYVLIFCSKTVGCLRR